MAIPVGLLEWNPTAGTKKVFSLYAAGSSDSATNANYHVYRWNSLSTVDLSGTEWQCGTFWDEDEHLVIAKRSKTAGTWSAWTTFVYDGVAETPEILRTDIDNHNNANNDVDSEGIIHVAYDHHSVGLNYRRSTVAIDSFTGTLTAEVSMVGTNEDSVSYPTFFKDPLGVLYFAFRSGAPVASSGDGNLYIYKYDTTTDTWAALAGTTAGLVIDGQNSVPDQSPYWNGPPRFTADWDGAGTGRMKLAWVWRTSPASDNHDLSYVEWDGTDWFKTTGAQTMPITLANCEVVDAAVAADNVASFNTMALDSDGHPHLIYGKDSTIVELGGGGTEYSRIWHVYHNGSAWSTPAAIEPMITTHNADFSNSTLDMCMDADDTIRCIVVAPTSTTLGMYALVSENASWTDWRFENLTTGDVSVAEGTGTDVSASHDRYQWEQNGVYMTMVPLAGDAGGLVDACPEAWTHTVEATVTNPSSDLTDPFFIIDGATLGSAFWDNVQSDLGDVRLTDGNGGMLPCYVYSYDYGAEEAVIFGRWLGTLATSGTQKVQVHCGNATATTEPVDSYFGQYNVFEDDWRLIYPQGGGANVTYLTGAANDLTMTSATAGDVAGPFGSLPATNYDGAASVAKKSTISPFGTAPTTLTMICWAKSDSDTAQQALIGLSDTADTDRYLVGWFNGTTGGDPVEAHSRANGVSAAVAVGPGYTASAWHHIAFRYPTTTSRYAVVDGTTGAQETTARTPDGIDTIAIGARVITTTGFYFDGAVSMAQFSFRDVSQAEVAWQSAQTNQATFWGTWTEVGVSEAPTITSSATFNAAENQTTVGTITATGSPAPTFSITGGADSALFAINSNSGVLTFTSGRNFEVPTDANTDGVYVVQITATNTEGTDSDTISITVTNVNEAPTTVNISSGSILTGTNTTGGCIVGILTTTDVDAANTHTYTIVGGADQGVFTIENDDELVIDDGVLDIETKDEYVVIVRSTDQGTLTRDETFTITVSTPVSSRGNFTVSMGLSI
jgi:hypothetical protein